MIPRRQQREKTPASPRRRAVVGLIPLTVVVIWLMNRAVHDRTDSPHGPIRLALAVLAFAGLALFWLGVLRLPKKSGEG